MDLGRFQRSRLTLGLWLGVPILLVVLTLLPSWIYLRYAHKDLSERQRLMTDVPMVEKLQKEIGTLLKAVTPEAERLLEATEEATRRLDQAAKNAGVTLRSIKVGEGEEQADAEFKSLTILVQLAGPLRAMVQWLDEIQRPGLLIQVQSATLNAVSLPPDQQFAGDVTLIIRLRKSG